MPEKRMHEQAVKLAQHLLDLLQNAPYGVTKILDKTMFEQCDALGQPSAYPVEDTWDLQVRLEEFLEENTRSK